MRSRITRKRIVQVLLVVVIVAFALRESRILWGIKEFEMFDLGYWGIQISDEVYTMQNVIVLLDATVVLVYLTRRSSPKVRSKVSHAPKEESPTRETSRKRRDKKSESPFTMVNEKWKLVSKNPKEES